MYDRHLHDNVFFYILKTNPLSLHFHLKSFISFKPRAKLPQVPASYTSLFAHFGKILLHGFGIPLHLLVQ